MSLTIICTWPPADTKTHNNMTEQWWGRSKQQWLGTECPNGLGKIGTTFLNTSHSVRTVLAQILERICGTSNNYRARTKGGEREWALLMWPALLCCSQASRLRTARKTLVRRRDARSVGTALGSKRPKPFWWHRMIRPQPCRLAGEAPSDSLAGNLRLKEIRNFFLTKCQ